MTSPKFRVRFFRMLHLPFIGESITITVHQLLRFYRMIDFTIWDGAFFCKAVCKARYVPFAFVKKIQHPVIYSANLCSQLVNLVPQNISVWPSQLRSKLLKQLDLCKTLSIGSWFDLVQLFKPLD